MQDRTSISAKEFCQYHQVEISFLHSLHEYGLLAIDIGDNEDCLLDSDDLATVEKLVRLHYDLQINLEGIDAIHHLLQKVEALQKEVSFLRSRLRLHEMDHK